MSSIYLSKTKIKNEKYKPGYKSFKSYSRAIQALKYAIKSNIPRLPALILSQRESWKCIGHDKSSQRTNDNTLKRIHSLRVSCMCFTSVTEKHFGLEDYSSLMRFTSINSTHSVPTQHRAVGLGFTVILREIT